MSSAKLAELYYDEAGAGSYGGVEALYRRLRTSGDKLNREGVREWLADQEPYSLHKPARKRFKRRATIVSDIDSQWQADLIDMSQFQEDNEGCRYILAVIDVLSKYAYVEPLKDKKGSSVANAFKRIFMSGRAPAKLQTDAGKEFLNKPLRALLKQRGVHHFVTHSEVKASIVERFIRTFKTKVWRYLTAKNTLKYVNVLQSFARAYNATYHRSIKTAPVEVTRANSLEIWRRLYGKKLKEKVTRKPLAIGDHVRISKLKGVFTKGYEQSYSEEIFIVDGVALKEGVYVYRLVDFQRDPVKGIFYGEEVQKVSGNENRVYKIEKIISTKGSGRSKRCLVKWRGWPSKFNSWVSASSLEGV